jgi:hypothetical protein
MSVKSESRIYFLYKDIYYYINGLIGVTRHTNNKATLWFESWYASSDFYSRVKEIVGAAISVHALYQNKVCHTHKEKHFCSVRKGEICFPNRRCLLSPLPDYPSHLNAFDWLMSFWKGNSNKLFFGERIFFSEEHRSIREELEEEMREENDSNVSQGSPQANLFRRNMFNEIVSPPSVRSDFFLLSPLSPTTNGDYISPTTPRSGSSKTFDFAVPLREKISDIRESDLKK